MDEHLAAIAARAEAGKPCFPLRVLVDGHLLVGTPQSTSVFYEAMDDPLRREVFAGVSGEIGAGRIGRKSQAKADRAARFDALMPPLEEALDEVRGVGVTSMEGGDVLTLCPAQFFPTSGPGLWVPAVRVAIAAITAWWIAGGQELRAEGDTGGGGGSWFVGGFVTE